jgi:hypothetical protein
MAKMPRNTQDCFREAAEAAGRKLGPDALEDYYFRAQGRIGRYVREGLSPEAAAMRAGQELGEEAQLARAIEKRQARVNAMARTGLTDRAMPGRFFDSAMAVIDGVENKGAFKNAALSLRAMGDMQVRDRTNAFFHDLDQAGLVKPFKGHWWRGPDPTFERDVANELGRIDDPTWGRDTGNSQAKKMAEIIHRHQDALRLAENDAGAFIGKLDQYLARQSHDRFKIQRAGYEKWRGYITPKLGERTFQDMLPHEIEPFLHQTYNNLATGIHAGSEQGDWIAGFKGPANLAKKLSGERKLFFKSADDWIDYNREFGNGSLNGTVLSTLERGSRAVEAMQMLGTNPRAMLDGWIDDMTKAARDNGTPEGIDEAKRLSQQKDKMLRLYDIAMRAPRAIENETMAQAFAVVRTWQRFKLGGAMLSSIPDLAATAAMARHNGIGALDSLSWHISQLFPPGAERKAAMREAAIGFDHMAQSLQTRFGAEDGVPGTLAKLVDNFTRLSGQPWWTDSMKEASTLMLLHNVAEKAALAHDALPRRMQTTLRRYGIEAAEWDALRAARQQAPDGNNYLFAGDIADPVLQKKYATYIADQVQEGMSEATAKVQDLMGHGGKSGELWDETKRTIMQFKQFPVTFMFRSLAREWGRDGKDISGMAQLIAGTTLFGYLAMTAKDLARGKEPFVPGAKDYDASQYAKQMMRAMVQGGGLGLYGDFLMGEVSRTGAGPILSLLGPAAGMTNDLVNALVVKPREAAMEGRLSAGRVGADVVQFAKNNAPFINLFWARSILDYGVLYSLQETLNPGYLARTEQRAQKDTGQQYLLSPSQNHLPVFGR